MIPPGFAGVEDQLTLLGLMSLRPGAAMLTAPGFGAAALPVRLRVLVAIAIGIAALGAHPPTLPAGGMASGAGLVIIAGEIAVGAALGLAVQLGYAASLIAGELIAGAMGLSVASAGDPSGTGSVPVIGSFLSLAALLLFFAGDGHLALIAAVIDSYAAWPPGGVAVSALAQAVPILGSSMFAAALVIALPVGFATLLVQFAMALVARSAPQLNLFAVGLPAALGAGLVFMALAMPVMGDAMIAALDDALTAAQGIAGGG